MDNCEDFCEFAPINECAIKDEPKMKKGGWQERHFAQKYGLMNLNELV